VDSTVEHIVGATEPMGYSERVQYDYQYRTTAVDNDEGLATTIQWDPVQDLEYSTTNPEGLMSTNVYNDENQLVAQYGPAPASDFDTWNTTLANNTSLPQGQSLWSPDHRFQLIYQTDGNVVEYGPNGAMWATNTGGDTSTQLVMQNDGDLVLYNGSTVLWASGTGGNPGAYLTIQDDGNIVLYNSTGPVGSTGTGGWAPADGGESSSGYDTPPSADANQVPTTTTDYDQGDSGLSVNYFGVSAPSGSQVALTGAPLLHTTNIASDGTMSADWGSTSPIPGHSGAWGFSATGTMRLPTAGDWTFTAYPAGGMRMWINNQLVIDYWTTTPTGDGPIESSAFDNTTANSPVSVRIDYYTPGTGTAQFALDAIEPSGTETSQVAQYLSPGYGLQTSTTSDDSTIGNSTVTTSYGSDPGLGQVASTTVDPTGLDLTTSDTYQAPGSGYGMLTSTTAPGGAETSYSYYVRRGQYCGISGGHAQDTYGAKR